MKVKVRILFQDANQTDDTTATQADTEFNTLAQACEYVRSFTNVVAFRIEATKPGFLGVDSSETKT